MWSHRRLREKSRNKGRKEEWRREARRKRRGKEEDTEARQAEGNVAIQPLMTHETECAIFVSRGLLAIERFEALIHATGWTNPGHMMPSKRSQTRKTTYCMIPFP